jgi:hypothetical protein
MFPFPHNLILHPAQRETLDKAHAQVYCNVIRQGGSAVVATGDA